MANNSKKTKILLVCGVLLLATVSASWTLSEGTLGNHECFVSITAREMLASGDWVWPTCNGQPRLVKTPLSYWLVAGLAKITGRVDEFTARLPSVIFAVLSVAAIIYFVNYLVSFRTALICAAVWATSLNYIRQAHNARPEMAMTFFIVLAFLSFYGAVIAQSRKRQIAYALVFWLTFALSNLAKGPAPLPLVLIPLFFYVAIFRKWRILPKLLPIIGTLIFLAIVLPWPLAIAHKLNWDIRLWKTEFVDRFLGEYRPGGKPFYYYSFIMFLFIIPWVVFLPIALAAPFYRVWNKKRPLMQFLWLWFVVDIVFLTICGGKRQHYILPLMPAMAILVGILIEDMAFIHKAYSSRFAKTVLAGHVIGVIALAVAGSGYLIKTYPNKVAEVLILGTVAVILTAVVVVLFAAGKPAVACGTLFGGIVVLVMIGYVTLLNPLDYERYSRDFSRRLTQIVPQSDNLIAYEYISNRSVQYFGRVIPEIMDKSVLYERYEQGDWVVATAGHLEKLQTDGKMKMVYYKQKAERRWQQDAPGALFHKSTPFVAKEP
jgi:4-amino-4-deoxy-L-arabinose transferase-like glycosyltransferase